MIDALALPSLSLQRTSKYSHRVLSLYTLGFDPTPQTLLATVKSLSLAGNSTRAALHALLLSAPKLASIALRSGPRATQHRALGLLLLRLSTSSSSTSAKNTTNSLPTPSPESIAHLPPTTDPFVPAILSLLTSSFLVDRPRNLPPAYHIALALNVLADAPLFAFLTTTLRDADSVSYLPLTGLTSQSLPIFKRYVAKTDDIQTAVLALGSVRGDFYLSTGSEEANDEKTTRWEPILEAWRLSYRAMLNSWKLWVQRARLDVLATRIAATSTLPPASRNRTVFGGPPLQRRQVTLACTSCEAALHRDSIRGLSVPSIRTSALTSSSAETTSSAGRGQGAGASAGV